MREELCNQGYVISFIINRALNCIPILHSLWVLLASLPPVNTQLLEDRDSRPNTGACQTHPLLHTEHVLNSLFLIYFYCLLLLEFYIPWG